MKEEDYCKKCGGFMDKVEGITYPECPPKYEYKCRSCGHKEIK